MEVLQEIAEPELRDYLSQALARWDEEGHLPDKNALREIAESVEMSYALSEESDRIAQEFTARAENVLTADQEKHPEAEALLRAAALLSPVRLEPHLQLARLYGRYFRRYRNEGHRVETVYLAQHCLALDPDNTPAHALLEEMGVIRKNDGISWKHAAMIVGLLVLLSGTMSLCVRYTLVPDVDPEETEVIRRHFEEQGPPQRR